MRLDEIEPDDAAQQRVKQLKASATAAADKAKQLRARANTAADTLGLQKSRQATSQIQKAAVTSTVKPYR